MPERHRVIVKHPDVRGVYRNSGVVCPVTFTDIASANAHAKIVVANGLLRTTAEIRSADGDRLEIRWKRDESGRIAPEHLV